MMKPEKIPVSIWPLGTFARLRNEDLTGQIVQVLIESPGASPQYKITWWSGSDKRTEWFYEFEFSIDTLDFPDR